MRFPLVIMAFFLIASLFAGLLRQWFDIGGYTSGFVAAIILVPLLWYGINWAAGDYD